MLFLLLFVLSFTVGLLLSVFLFMTEEQRTILRAQLREFFNGDGPPMNTP